ncbi:hypothetical protein [uncultured Pseudacidovorax sp.]|uniref:hypothetical protein n=1 Tax=uncultured Pseudacidovorax sp. TaxID=679313 RepID=UPI0025E64238|nr:hypothetical protein [uncultured Pseudacidovorax sp.]
MPRFEDMNVLGASISLETYKLHGFGEQLFAAFLQWRDAQREGARPEELEAIARELMPCIEEVMRDLWKITQQMRASDERLRSDLQTQLRAALRIGKGGAPVDALKAHKKVVHVALVEARYEEMSGTYEEKSRERICREVSDFLKDKPESFGLPRGLGWETVQSDWEEHLEEHPELAQRITLIEQMAALHSASCSEEKLAVLPDRKKTDESKRRAAAAPPTPPLKPRNTKKPKSWR